MQVSEAPSSTTLKLQPVHLLVCVHGMWGHPDHMARLAEVVQETYDTSGKDPEEHEVELDVLIAETNKESHTYDGVDWGAERVVQEIKERIKSIETPAAESSTATPKKVTRFSIIGYSLGGLLARYTVGILQSQNFFESNEIEPVNFATIATPNIGLLRYPTFVSSLFSSLGPTFLSRTGKHFYAKDDEWEGKKPLLEVMSEPGTVFYQALTRFKNVSFYANAINDLTVPFITAAAETYDPFVSYAVNGIEVELDDKYSPIIKSYTLPEGGPPPLPPKPEKFTAAWFKNKWNGPSWLPPPLQGKPFPTNVAIYASVPILIPLLTLLIVGNFTYNVHTSGRRIKALEASGTGNRSSIMNLMQRVEGAVEGVVVDFVEQEIPPQPDSTGPSSSPTPARAASPTPPPEAASTALPDPLPTATGRSSKADSKLKCKSKSRHRSKSITYSPIEDKNSRYHSTPASDLDDNQPIISDAQHRIIANLNSLPNLKKYYVFLDGLRNSHATIVARDLKRFEFHKRGEGVLRHVADNFEL